MDNFRLYPRLSDLCRGRGLHDLFFFLWSSHPGLPGLGQRRGAQRKHGSWLSAWCWLLSCSLPQQPSQCWLFLGAPLWVLGRSLWRPCRGWCDQASCKSHSLFLLRHPSGVECFGSDPAIYASSAQPSGGQCSINSRASGCSPPLLPCLHSCPSASGEFSGPEAYTIPRVCAPQTREDVGQGFPRPGALHQGGPLPGHRWGLGFLYHRHPVFRDASGASVCWEDLSLLFLALTSAGIPGHQEKSQSPSGGPNPFPFLGQVGRGFRLSFLGSTCFSALCQGLSSSLQLCGPFSYICCPVWMFKSQPYASHGHSPQRWGLSSLLTCPSFLGLRNPFLWCSVHIVQHFSAS